MRWAGLVSWIPSPNRNNLFRIFLLTFSPSFVSLLNVNPTFPMKKLTYLIDRPAASEAKTAGVFLLVNHAAKTVRISRSVGNMHRSAKALAHRLHGALIVTPELFAKLSKTFRKKKVQALEFRPFSAEAGTINQRFDLALKAVKTVLPDYRVENCLEHWSYKV